MTENMTDGTGAPSRRAMLYGLAGGAVVGGVVGGGVATAASGGGGHKSESLTVDCACLGQTWRDVIPRNNKGLEDARIPFMVEGLIYPEGHIPVEGFIPTSEGSIGTWFCRGWVIIDGDRLEPHVLSDQHYVLGSIEVADGFPPDGLMSQGIEGSLSFGWRAPRVVTGGTGRYRNAGGEVVQEHIGFNTTVLDDGLDDNALNFRFHFDLTFPD